jgi:membrane-associated phospholipid phosphatase
MTVSLKVSVDPRGSSAVEWLVAALLLASRIWWERSDHRRIADACGTIGAVALGGMACGAIAMLGLRLGFPLADHILHSIDQLLRLDGLAIVEWLAHQPHWTFWVMAPAYNLTIPIFFGGLALLSYLGDRLEAWRGAFCFVGTLLTTCLIAMFVPAKGLGVWAGPELFSQLPEQAMRTFWPHFDTFYFGHDPVLRLQVVDGVVSFPSFHAIVGFLVLAMWRHRPFARAAAAIWLGVMLVSTLPGGGHYVVDLLAGFVVWAVWFTASKFIERRAQVDQRLPS